MTCFKRELLILLELIVNECLFKESIKTQAKIRGLDSEFLTYQIIKINKATKNLLDGISKEIIERSLSF